jgi:hypothetical protein
MGRHAVLALLGCNAIFGIEEGVELTGGQGGSDLQMPTPALATGGQVSDASGRGGGAGATTAQRGSDTVLPPETTTGVARVYRASMPAREASTACLQG